MMTQTETPRLAGRGASKARTTRREHITTRAEMQERARLFSYNQEMIDALSPSTRPAPPPRDRVTIDDLLGRLDGVRRSGNGWLARCPSHDDQDPSLSVREGDRATLLRCWAGCSIEEIAHSLGIEVRDLFHDALDRDPHVRREAAHRREIAHDRRAQERRARGALLDSRREAEDLILSARGINIEEWDDEKLDRVLDALGWAYHILADERLEEEAAA